MPSRVSDSAKRPSSATAEAKPRVEIIHGTVAELFGSGPGEFYDAKPIEPGRVTMQDWQKIICGVVAS